MMMQTHEKRHTIWLLSPYHSGSHRAWALDYQGHSRHRVILLTMPGRFWKWRMQGGALELAAQARALVERGERPDLVIATDMVNVPAWLALVRTFLPSPTPMLLYMHENQLTYPWRPGEKPDFTYAMINWLSQAVADHVLFNSRYHLAGWFDELPRLLKHFPDYNHLALVDDVRSKSSVLPVGIDATTFAHARPESLFAPPSSPAPLILWNQRWEYDKRPDRFFNLLYQLDDAGVPFRVAVAGENFRNVPEEFEEAQARLAAQMVHWGYVPSREAYVALLQQADLVVSTADHEFFGISVLEAVSAGAFPLLPHRLSYPELIPTPLHPACLYADEAALYAMATNRLTSPRPAPPSLQEHVLAEFDWQPVAASYDRLVEEIINGK